MRTITLINRSTVVTDADFQACVSALQTQIDRDLCPVWAVTATLRTAAAGSEQDSGERIYVLDDADQAGALGYHEDDVAGLPIGFVFARTSLQAGEPWQTTASHELLEQLVDPFIIGEVLARWRGRAARITLEVADPVEGDTYSIGTVPVSNFITPWWYGGQVPAGAKYDYLGKLTKPLSMTPGGYVSYSSDLIRWHQQFGRRHVREHGPLSRLLRRHRRKKKK